VCLAPWRISNFCDPAHTASVPTFASVSCVYDSLPPCAIQRLTCFFVTSFSYFISIHSRHSLRKKTVHAVRSGRVDVERLLPPEFPLINPWFCFDTFQYKFHHTCTRSGAWRTTMTTELTSREAAITVLSVWKERFWCAHYSRGLFFPIACSDNP